MFESTSIAESSVIILSLATVLSVTALLLSCLRCSWSSLPCLWWTREQPSLPALHTAVETTDSVVFEPLPEQVISVTAGGRHEIEETDGKIEKSSITFNDTIGHGWFGWIVSGNLKSAKVLVKVLKEEASPEQIERFRQEHDSWAGVSHSNVIRVVGSCFSSFPMLSLMEWSCHLSAKTLLLSRQSQPDLDLSLQLSMDACAGVAALHDKSVVIKDLAVRNCVLTEHNVLKIADYGLGRAAFPADYWPVMTDSVPLRWTSPAQLALPPHRSLPEYLGVTREDNLWSLAVLLWELLTYCRQPYQGLNDKEVLQLLLDREDAREHFRADLQTSLKYKCVARLAINNLDLDQSKRYRNIPSLSTTLTCLS